MAKTTRLNRPSDLIDHIRYKGYDLHLCWCGYPETRWLVTLGRSFIGTKLHLKEAKSLVNGRISQPVPAA